MKAMILAAGLGTRLRPLTEVKPKALVPVVNRPIISRTVDYLRGQGIDRIIINAHHHADQILDYVRGGRPFGVDALVRVEPDILGTGGGIANTADFWDADPFIVINSDILTDIDLRRAYDAHRRRGNLATLILHDYPPFNQIHVDSDGDILKIGGTKASGSLAFTGIHIIDPRLLDHLPAGQFSDIIDCYRSLIRAGRPIGAFLSENHYWRDIGSIESYRLANRELLREPFAIEPGSRIHASAVFKDWAVVGENTNIEEGAEVIGSILWERVTVRKGIRVVKSIVTSSRTVGRDLHGEIY